jgi:hypothetical protein
VFLNDISLYFSQLSKSTICFLKIYTIWMKRGLCKGSLQRRELLYLVMNTLKERALLLRMKIENERLLLTVFQWIEERRRHRSFLRVYSTRRHG